MDGSYVLFNAYFKWLFGEFGSYWSQEFLIRCIIELAENEVNAVTKNPLSVLHLGPFPFEIVS